MKCLRRLGGEFRAIHAFGTSKIGGKGPERLLFKIAHKIHVVLGGAFCPAGGIFPNGEEEFKYWRSEG